MMFTFCKVNKGLVSMYGYIRDCDLSSFFGSCSVFVSFHLNYPDRSRMHTRRDEREVSTTRHLFLLFYHRVLTAKKNDSALPVIFVCRGERYLISTWNIPRREYSTKCHNHMLWPCTLARLPTDFNLCRTQEWEKDYRMHDEREVFYGSTPILVFSVLVLNQPKHDSHTLNYIFTGSCGCADLYGEADNTWFHQETDQEENILTKCHNHVPCPCTLGSTANGYSSWGTKKERKNIT